MRARRRTVLVALLGVVLVAAGCGAEPETPPNPFPPRPKNLDLSNVDLCATLTTAQKEERGIDRDRESVANVSGEMVPTCSWSDDDTSDSWAVQLFDGSAAVALQTPGSYVTEVSGYGAVRGPNENPDPSQGDPPFCQIDLDASDTRSLRVQYENRQGDYGVPAEQEAACQMATRLAEDIFGNLSRRSG